MASYLYERDIKEEDLRPVREKHYTRKERWNNWWDYNLKWVLIAAVVIGFVGYSFIGQYLFTVHPDYNVAVVSPYYLPDDTLEALQTQLAAYGEDLNGDGETVVTVNVYTVDYSGGGDAYLAMAGTTKLFADVQGALSSIYILADPAGFEENTGALRYLDGSLPEGGSDEDWWNMVYRWTDCPVLTGLELGGYGPDATQAYSGDSQEYMSRFYVAFRGAWNDGSADSIAPSEPLWQALTAGAVSTAAEDAE